jgi:hypothetical protein
VRTARKASGKWFASEHEKEPVLGLAIPWDHEFLDQQGMGAVAN